MHMLSAVQHYAIVSAICIAVVLALSLLLMRTLWLPRTGCWLFYFSTMAAILVALTTGLVFIVAAKFLKHYVDDPAHKGQDLWLLGCIPPVLMFIGQLLLKAWKKSPFKWIMKRFVRVFKHRVGTIRPALESAHPALLAYKAVWDDAYADPRYGPKNGVKGWGVKACSNRLIRIKHNQ